MKGSIVQGLVSLILLFNPDSTSASTTKAKIQPRQGDGPNCHDLSVDQFCAPPDWTSLYKEEKCTAKPESHEPIHPSTNRGPSSGDDCDDPHGGLRRSRLFRRDEEGHSGLQEGVFQESPHALEVRGNPANIDIGQNGKVCTWTLLGVVTSELSGACETLPLFVETGKDVLVSWAFQYAVQKVIMYRTDIAGGQPRCAGYYTPPSLDSAQKSSITIPNFKKQAFYHFQFIFDEAAKLAGGKVATWKRANLG